MANSRQELWCFHSSTSYMFSSPLQHLLKINIIIKCIPFDFLCSMRRLHDHTDLLMYRISSSRRQTEQVRVAYFGKGMSAPCTGAACATTPVTPPYTTNFLTLGTRVCSLLPSMCCGCVRPVGDHNRTEKEDSGMHFPIVCSCVKCNGAVLGTRISSREHVLQVG
jgi:hypothetical protein